MRSANKNYRNGMYMACTTCIVWLYSAVKTSLSTVSDPETLILFVGV